MLFRAFDETITTTVRFGVVCMCSIRRSSDVKPTTLILAFFLVFVFLCSKVFCCKRFHDIRLFVIPRKNGFVQLYKKGIEKCCVEFVVYIFLVNLMPVSETALAP